MRDFNTKAVYHNIWVKDLLKDDSIDPRVVRDLAKDDLAQARSDANTRH